MSIIKNTNDLITSAFFGDVNEVKRLIPLSFPQAYNSRALRNAAKGGHTDCVKLLIPVSDALDLSSCALIWASEEQHPECVDLLFECSDPATALYELQTEYPHEPEKWRYLEHKIVEHQKIMLNNHVEKEADTSVVKLRKI